MTGTFPRQFKQSKVIYFYKKGDRTNIANYRPISITSFFAKLFELTILKQMTHFAVKFNIISAEQYGFQKTKSTTDLLTTLYDTLLYEMDQSKFTTLISLDVAKAFDRLNHRYLLKKLKQYGYREKIHDLIESYLWSREVNIHYTSYVSDPVIQTIRIPQRSPLSAFLFILYVNNIFETSLCGKILCYADDIVYINSSRNLAFLHTTSQNDIQLNNWYRGNKL